jgi:lipoate synthase
VHVLRTLCGAQCLVLREISCAVQDRDDLPDGGTAHIAETVRRLKAETSGRLLVEALVPDFAGSVPAAAAVVAAGVDVYAHNIETVERLQPVVRDRRAGWEQSLRMLSAAKVRELRAAGILDRGACAIRVYRLTSLIVSMLTAAKVSGQEKAAAALAVGE